MITINIPCNFLPERSYIIDILFSEFLGLEYMMKQGDSRPCYEIILESGNILKIKDDFFSYCDDGLSYLDERNIPSRIISVTNPFVLEDNMPVIFGTDELIVSDHEITCGIDIFASSFFMLTRWEEHANKVRDDHDRFPSSASLGHKCGFLHRAIVNEYVEMLWKMLKFLKCGQERKARTFRDIATHDVDAPFLYGTKSMSTALKQMVGDVVKRRNGKLALDNAVKWLRVRRGELTCDPFYTYDDIMDLSECAGLKSTFLFIADHSEPGHDGDYKIRHKIVRRLIRHIHDRGHDIGLHLSYGSYRNPSQTKKELDILQTVCYEEGVEQKYWCSRQHFLRFEIPTTFDNLDHAQINCDSTLSYADAAGFRCGVCYEYPAFNILKRKRLNVREKPLLIMECSVIDQRYMNLGTGDESFSVMKSIKETCRKYRGDFVLLWHNTRFVDQREYDLYHQLLQF